MKKLYQKIKFILGNKVKFELDKLRWKKRNTDNYTVINNSFDLDKVTVGKGTYGGLCVHDFKSSEEGLEIGSFCSIGPHVEFFLGGEHHPNYVSNYPFTLLGYGNSVDQIEDRRTKGKIVVEDDVWIGANSIILSGVRIGQGAIVGAGSVVAKDIPPYSIYVGNRVVKKRFSDAIVNRLTKLDYSKFTKEYIKENLEYFYMDDICEVIKHFEQDGLIDAEME